ncbi:cytochrome P450 [Amylocystis lapponica]|nr:cytochrome P450 [Amylocystis lapponica]
MDPLFLALALAALVLVWSQLNKSRNFALPPGPKPLPLLGNVTNFKSMKELWLTTHKWAKQFGDVVYLHIFGQGMIFLNSYDATVDLMEKRGAIYSDKPELIMVGELCGCENMVAFTRYGDKLRRYRRLLQNALSVSAVRTYQPLIEYGTHTLLRRILTDPHDLHRNARHYAGSLTLLVVYGYRTTSKEDPFLLLGEECMDLLANHIASGSGLWLVDILPVLKRLPLWAPGSGFLRKAAKWKARIEDFVDRPYEHMKQRMREGTATPCFCTSLLDELHEKGEKDVDEQDDADIRWAANSIYAASLDTTTTVVLNFILAMVLHPEVLAKAQKEVDSVVGVNRLPNFDDRPSLPYIECVMSEVFRWCVPAPIGLPRRVMEDDVYNGMYIAKGSLLFGNIWKMCRDEELFADPENFYPERYMEDVDEMTARRRDPRHYVFGFGRRRCPGVNLVESAIWAVIVSMIATLDISKSVDEHGDVIEPEVDYSNAVFRTPSPFECNIRPRSEQAGRMIRLTADA